MDMAPFDGTSLDHDVAGEPNVEGIESSGDPAHQSPAA
jgi:hypothetical protein